MMKRQSKQAIVTTAALGLLGLFGASENASGSPVSVDPPPAGYTSVFSVVGADGIAEDPAKWFTLSEAPEEAVWTAWANKDISYNVDLGASDGEWLLGITAKNFDGGPEVLPPDYDAFRVRVKEAGAGVVGFAEIPASDLLWATTWISLGSRSGEMELELRWTNDSWTPGQYDANIAIGSLTFAQAVGVSAQSVPGASTAALMGVALLLGGRRSRVADESVKRAP